MKKIDVLPAWGRILRGRTPLLSIEITRECPLRCPGCYAYEPAHLGEAGPLRVLNDLKGTALISGVLDLVRQYRPLHLSIVGGEPLVRFRELDVLLPQLAEMGVEVQLVTSAVRAIPVAWNQLSNLHLVVSVDGLQAEHDTRRAPATYDRILKHIAGQQVTIHCTVTRQLPRTPEYFDKFAEFWSGREEVRKIWFSLYTPQEGEQSKERLSPDERRSVLLELAQLRKRFRKIELPDRVLDGLISPPTSPQECIFAQTTTCLSADLKTAITPCQFGGQPVCSECGCIASAAMSSLGRYKLAHVLPLSAIFDGSKKIGDWLRTSH